MIWVAIYLIPGIMLAVGCVIFDDKVHPKMNWLATLGALLLWPLVLYGVWRANHRG